MKYDSCGTGQTAGKKGSIKEDSLKRNVKENVTCSNNDNKSEPYKKGQSVSKKSDNERSDERKSKSRNAAKEKSFSRDEKPPEEQKKKLENDETDAKRTQKNINITSNASEDCRNNKINTTKSLESGKEKICNSSEGTQKENNGSVKQKDGSLKTSGSSKNSVVQKVKAETLTGKEAVAKKKLTVEEYKSKKRSESKDSLKNEGNKTSKAESKTVNDKSEKSTQPKTLKESEKLQQPRKSRSQKQIYKGDEERLSGKRKREDTPVRPQKVRKTKNVDTNKESVKFVKTKEAKLPGNVVTVRILKVDRGKALVLKRRHVNQLFIRGDNIIMVAHENVWTTEDKVVKTKFTAVPD
jgi:small nuclear ribonucleoprotein (snRNP)-like protein